MGVEEGLGKLFDLSGKQIFENQELRKKVTALELQIGELKGERDNLGAQMQEVLAERDRAKHMHRVVSDKEEIANRLKDEALQSIGGAWLHLDTAYKLVEVLEVQEGVCFEVKEAWKCVRAAKEALSLKRIVSRTNLERYLAVSMQMLMARADGRNEDSYLDQLDKLDELLTEDEKEFLKEMGKDWATR